MYLYICYGHLPCHQAWAQLVSEEVTQGACIHRKYFTGNNSPEASVGTGVEEEEEEEAERAPCCSTLNCCRIDAWTFYSSRSCSWSDFTADIMSESVLPSAMPTEKVP